MKSLAAQIVAEDFHSCLERPLSAIRRHAEAKQKDKRHRSVKCLDTFPLCSFQQPNRNTALFRGSPSQVAVFCAHSTSRLPSGPARIGLSKERNGRGGVVAGGSYCTLLECRMMMRRGGGGGDLQATEAVATTVIFAGANAMLRSKFCTSAGSLPCEHARSCVQLLDLLDM